MNAYAHDLPYKGEVFTVYVSPEDAHLLTEHRWQVMGYSDRPYVWTSIAGKTTYLHRLITNAPKGMDVDHMNGNALDNRRENLRVCTRSENLLNMRRGNRGKYSQHKGVGRTPAGKWRAYISVENKYVHLGHFDTEDEAVAAYEAKASELRGEVMA